MTADELLLNLQDIQPPPDPAWWLLPPGIWVLIALILISGIGWSWRRRRLDRNRHGASALMELDRIATRHAELQDDALLVRNLAYWLKRVALQAYPGQGLERMCGDRWLRFLDQSFGGNGFSRGQGMVFGDAVYRRHPEADTEALLALCRDWLKQVEPKLSRGRARC